MIKPKVMKKSDFIKNRKETFKKISVPLALFSLASIVLVSLTPAFVGISGGQPTLLQLSATGIVVIVLSALFIAWSSKILKLSAAWMILVTLFLSAVAIIKFIIVPKALYAETFRIDSGGLFNFAFDPNKTATYIWVSIVSFLILAGLYWVFYRLYRTEVIEVASNKRAKSTTTVSQRITLGVVIVVTLVFIAIGSGALSLLVFFPLVAFQSFSTYFITIATNEGLALFVTLVLAAILAFRSIQVSSHDAIATKQPMLIVSAAWLALSVLLLFHIIWIVYMTVLITLAPFKVVYFSSK
jgi:hypothetical protein